RRLARQWMSGNAFSAPCGLFGMFAALGPANDDRGDDGAEGIEDKVVRGVEAALDPLGGEDVVGDGFVDLPANPGGHTDGDRGEEARLDPGGGVPAPGKRAEAVVCAGGDRRDAGEVRELVVFGDVRVEVAGGPEGIGVAAGDDDEVRLP